MSTDSTPTVQPGAFLTMHYRLAGPDGADIVNTFITPREPVESFTHWVE